MRAPGRSIRPPTNSFLLFGEAHARPRGRWGQSNCRRLLANSCRLTARWRLSAKFRQVTSKGASAASVDRWAPPVPPPPPSWTGHAPVQPRGGRATPPCTSGACPAVRARPLCRGTPCLGDPPGHVPDPLRCLGPRGVTVPRPLRSGPAPVPRRCLVSPAPRVPPAAHDHPPKRDVRPALTGAPPSTAE